MKLSVFGILLFSLLLCNYDAFSQTALKISTDDPSNLNIVAKLDNTGITITNKETATLKNCRIDLNGSIISSGYLYYPEEIKPSKSLAINLKSFKSDEGEIFGSNEEPALKISVSCDTGGKDVKVFLGRFS